MVFVKEKNLFYLEGRIHLFLFLATVLKLVRRNNFIES